MIKKPLRKFFQSAKIKLLPLFSKNGRITSLYYFFTSKGFQDEQQKVLKGILQNKNNQNNIGNFRRAIHRIEKGLITQPSKSFFAESYILETVLIYKNLLNNKSEESMLLWAEGILNQYFETVVRTNTISKAYDEYQLINRLNKLTQIQTYQSIERVKSEINIEDFYKLTQQRRSIRYYQAKQVPRILIENAIKVALQSPSACNRQPFSFRIIDDPKLIRTAARLPNGSSTFSEGIPMMIFIIGDLSNYFDERDKHLIYIDSSLAAMSFVLGLEVQGLSSCIINWSDIPSNNKKLKAFLKLADWEQCIMSISVGFALPECGIPSSIKKDVKTVLKYN